MRSLGIAVWGVWGVRWNNLPSFIVQVGLSVVLLNTISMLVGFDLSKLLKPLAIYYSRFQLRKEQKYPIPRPSLGSVHHKPKIGCII